MEIKEDFILRKIKFSLKIRVISIKLVLLYAMRQSQVV